MINALKQWWTAIPKAQKAGLIVLAAFLAGVLVMSFGVTIGTGLAKVL